ncbi:MAG: chemotaxis protein CheX [Bacillota bacterium]
MNIEMLEPFIYSVKDMLIEIAKTDIDVEKIYYETHEIKSKGVTSIISFISKTKIKGRLLLDMEPELSLHIVNQMTDEKYEAVKDFMVLASLSEFNNIIAGHANTHINDRLQLGFRLSPPIVFTGDDIIVSVPKVCSVSIDGTTRYGKLTVNIAMEGGYLK